MWWHMPMETCTTIGNPHWEAAFWWHSTKDPNLVKVKVSYKVAYWEGFPCEPCPNILAFPWKALGKREMSSNVCKVYLLLPQLVMRWRWSLRESTTTRRTIEHPIHLEKNWRWKRLIRQVAGPGPPPHALAIITSTRTIKSHHVRTEGDDLAPQVGPTPLDLASSQPIVVTTPLEYGGGHPRRGG
jgi:hypothetical protein